MLWILVGLAAATVFWFLIVGRADEGQSARIGAWAQLVATMGTVYATALAFQTADKNRKQAKESSRAMAEATRPLLSLNMMPRVEGSARGEEVSEVRLSIVNHSKFDVKDGRVDWEMKNGATGEHKFGPIFAAANPESGIVSEHVSYAGDRKSNQYVPLGSHENFTPGVMRITLYYTSIFSGGEWMEIHYWKTSDVNSDNPDHPHWKLSHTYEPPKWIPTSS